MSGLSAFIISLIQSLSSSAVICLESCRTSFFVSSALLSETARCSITTSENIPLLDRSYPFTLTFFSAGINPCTVCPTIPHTRKLNFALSEGRSRGFSLPPPFYWGATCNLLEMKSGWWRNHFAAWTKPLTRARGESEISTGRTQTWLDTSSLCLSIRRFHTSICSTCWLSCLHGISPDTIQKTDN